MRVNECIAALLIALPAAAGEGPSLSVQEIRSRLPAGESEAADAGALADEVRDVARRILPDLRVTDAREIGDFAVTGELVRLENGFLVTLELRETKSAKLSGTASAAAGTPEELVEGVASAAVRLFRGYKEAALLVMAPAAQPAPPAPLAKLAAAEVDAYVLVAIDEARGAELQNPDDAASAWRAVAELPGANPYRETASERAKEWQAYAEGKRAFDAQLSRDTARLKKVLPLAAVTDATKTELLVRYTRAYGAQKATALLPLLPPAARPAAEFSVGCEAKQAAKCVALAMAADDAKVAAGYFEQACAAGDAGACAEAGARFLRAETRDPERAVAALQRGCASGGGAACARLARVYEEGDGAFVNLALAAETREKACAARDGASCRKLACDVPSELPRAAELWQRGCKEGDSISCALAQVAAPHADSVVRSQVAEAARGARPASTAAAAKSASSSPATAAAQATPETAPSASSRRGAGYAFLGFATAAAAGGILFMALQSPDEGYRHYSRNQLSEPRAASASGSGLRGLPLILGAGAVVSAGTGIGLLLSSPASPSKLSVGVAHSGVVLSGSLP
jgi:TPR repeat protein